MKHKIKIKDNGLKVGLSQTEGEMAKKGFDMLIDLIVKVTKGKPTFNKKK